MAKLWFTLFEDGKTSITCNKDKHYEISKEQSDKGNPPVAQKVMSGGEAISDKNIYDAVDDPNHPYTQRGKK